MPHVAVINGRTIVRAAHGEDLGTPPCADCGGKIDGHGENFRIVSIRSPLRRGVMFSHCKLVHITCPE